jgi:hypothetical protein
MGSVVGGLEFHLGDGELGALGGFFTACLMGCCVLYVFYLGSRRIAIHI